MPLPDAEVDGAARSGAQQRVHLRAMRPTVPGAHRSAAGGPKRTDVEGYLHTLVDKARSPRTRNVQLGAIRCLLLATVRRDPSAAIPRAKAPRVVPQILSGTEVARLLAATTSPKYRAIHARLRGGPRAGRYRRGRSDTRFGRFRLNVPQGAPIRTSSRRKP
jgi:site-specific recombinase XerD